jgi:hypothetical protein
MTGAAVAVVVAALEAAEAAAVLEAGAAAAVLEAGAAAAQEGFRPPSPHSSIDCPPDRRRGWSTARY